MDPLSGRDVIADNAPAATAEQTASPQWNYRDPGEPENALDNDETDDWDGGTSGSHVKTRTQHGLSEYAGMSVPKTLKELDDENTWSSAR